MAILGTGSLPVAMSDTTFFGGVVNTCKGISIIAVGFCQENVAIIAEGCGDTALLIDIPGLAEPGWEGIVARLCERLGQRPLTAAGLALAGASAPSMPVRIVVSNRLLRFAVIDGQWAAATAEQRKVRVREALCRRYGNLDGWTYSFSMGDGQADSAIGWALETALLWELHSAFDAQGLRILEIVPAFVAGFGAWCVCGGLDAEMRDGLYAMYEAKHLLMAVRSGGNWRTCKAFGTLVWRQVPTVLQWMMLDAGQAGIPAYLIAPGKGAMPPPRTVCMQLPEDMCAAEVFARWAAAG